ncbi:MAG: amidohydrolase family protein [Chitinophagaceae bacterium]
MRYRKFRPERLFTGYEVLTGYTLVTTENGTIEEVVPNGPDHEDAEVLPGLLSPGFVNCHCHLELSHMKGRIPEGTGLVDFVFRVITERHDEKEVMLDAINKAEQEMISGGIVAVGDICNNPITLLPKIRKNLYYHNFIEASGFVPAVVPERFKRSVDLFNVYCELYKDPQASNSIVPHAPYSVAKELFKRISKFPGNRLLTMHNQETEAENDLYRDKTGDFLQLYEKMKIGDSFFIPPGTTSLQACLNYFFPQQTLILVHNVATSEDDMQYIKNNATPVLYFCLCPNANLYITGQLPPVDLLIQYNSRIVLGTDSLASNRQLSILSEIKTLKKNFPHLTYEQVLPWATINGASALGIEHTFGSFEKGKKPGTVLIDNAFESVKRVL